MSCILCLKYIACSSENGLLTTRNLCDAHYQCTIIQWSDAQCTSVKMWIALRRTDAGWHCAKHSIGAGLSDQLWSVPYFWRHTLPYCAALCRIVLYCAITYCAVLRHIVPYCTVLCCIVLHCALLYGIVPYFETNSDQCHISAFQTTNSCLGDK